MRIGVQFTKTGMAKYISHLDLQRAFGRAIRRSGLPVKMSEGFNPHYVMSFASALALGMQSSAECVEFVLKQEVKPELFVFALNRALPKGLEAKRAAALAESAPKLMAAVREALYEVTFANCDIGMLNSAVCDIMNQSSIVAVKKSKGRQKQFDIRPMILGIEIEQQSLKMRLAAAPSGSLKPEFVIDEILKRIGQCTYSIERTGLFAHKGEEPADLLDFCSE